MFRWLLDQMLRCKSNIFPLHKKCSSGDIWGASLFAQAKSEDIRIACKMLQGNIEEVNSSLQHVSKRMDKIHKHLFGVVVESPNSS